MMTNTAGGFGLDASTLRAGELLFRRQEDNNGTSVKEIRITLPPSPISFAGASLPEPLIGC